MKKSFIRLAKDIDKLAEYFINENFIINDIEYQTFLKNYKEIYDEYNNSIDGNQK